MVSGKNEGKAPKSSRGRGVSQAQAQMQGGVGNSVPKRAPQKLVAKGNSR